MPAENRSRTGSSVGRPGGAINGSHNGGGRNGGHSGYSNSSGDGGHGAYSNNRSNGRESYGRSYNGNYNGNGYGNNRNDRFQRNEFTYEITDSYGVLSISPTGWTKELNRVSWNGKEPKFDIREWSPDHGRMRRGVTFTEEEALELRDLLETAIAGLPISVFTDSDQYDDRSEGMMNSELDLVEEEAAMTQLDSGSLIDDADDVLTDAEADDVEEMSASHDAA